MFKFLNGAQATKVIVFVLAAFTLTLVVLYWPNSTAERKNEEIMGEEQTARGPTVGGLGKIRESDPEVESLVNQVKEKLEEKTGTIYESLKVVHYKTQLVAGINYFVKAIAKTLDGVESTIHLRIYKDLKRNLELTSHKLDQPADAELLYF